MSDSNKSRLRVGGLAALVTVVGITVANNPYGQAILVVCFVLLFEAGQMWQTIRHTEQMAEQVERHRAMVDRLNKALLAPKRRRRLMDDWSEDREAIEAQLQKQVELAHHTQIIPRMTDDGRFES